MAKKPKLTKSIEVKIGKVKFVESGKGALVEELSKGADSVFIPKELLNETEGAEGKLFEGQVVQFEILSGEVKSIKTIE
ncbi:hypothetical protein KA005_43530 [bacterium]|nr:hypothetical protein [bacterium]